MKTYVCTDHDSHYPVGCASVVIATDETEARALLDAQLLGHSLRITNYTLREVLPNTAEVLNDGNY